MYSLRWQSLFSVIILVSGSFATNILLTNDDGWAVAMIRAQNDALKEAGYNVVLSCPAENKSGTGSSTTTPTTLTEPCEYDTCPTGSPAEGYNATDPTLNYVNGYPVDSARYGIQTLAPKFFNGSQPDFVVSGPNVGNNLGSTVQISGTVGAACEAALEGIPSISFSGSGSSLSQISYTTLTSSPSSTDTLAAQVYSAATVDLVNALLASPAPYLPTGIVLNVNYPSLSDCSSASDYEFVLTRILSDSSATDVQTCGTTHLPAESDVVGGCYASVSVYNASTKADVDAATQEFVLNRLGNFLTCYDS
ncbi:survival protein sure-like phosphatase/nucleotidase [Neolentinus lepideus HHB14362 ss-1]|uniref:Survival protein sure-like phosphatase/nucleotidase n=1 Tax=Neolentinus lepideus HHB14362 ss-1 TaxID=1314782 RepID=A0A165SED3_9AGAM|nr:survival protein sure-like phosphatase/nucleotidase [Neolentinus lepideus HHB14362 ss-1]